MQEAYRPPRSKWHPPPAPEIGYLLSAGWGTPHLDLGWGTPSAGWDTNLPGPGMGYPSPGHLQWVPPHLDLGWGTPISWMGYPLLHLDLGWGTPLVGWMGYPPPRNVKRQTPVKTVPSLVLRTRAVKMLVKGCIF